MSDESRNFFARNFYDNPHFWAIASSTVLGIIAMHAWGVLEDGYQLLVPFVAVIICVSGVYFVVVGRFRKLEAGLARTADQIGRLTSDQKDAGGQISEVAGAVKNASDHIGQLADGLAQASDQVAQLAASQKKAGEAANNRAMLVLETMEKLDAVVVGVGTSEKERREGAKEAARVISESFGTAGGTKITTCIKVLERPERLKGGADPVNYPPELITFSRIAAWPNPPDGGEGRHPLHRSSPLQLLYQNAELPYFLDNHLPTLRHLLLHTTENIKSLLVLPITTFDGANLGFLWLASDREAAFDESLSPKFAAAAAARVAPLLLPFVHLAQASDESRDLRTQGR